MPVRLVPHRLFPPYAYLPGRHLHPVRDAGGHSYGIKPTVDIDGRQWGADLFDAGYYWEAHEAWEPFWQAASGSERALLKALILLAAAGLKLREGKTAAAHRHAGRAMDGISVADATGGSASFDKAARCLRHRIEDVPWLALPLSTNPSLQPAPVFSFLISAVIDAGWPIDQSEVA